jgi:hypothetical protein
MLLDTQFPNYKKKIVSSSSSPKFSRKNKDKCNIFTIAYYKKSDSHFFVLYQAIRISWTL